MKTSRFSNSRILIILKLWGDYLGHKPSSTADRHYRVRPFDLLCRWHVKLEEWIFEQAGYLFR